MPKNPFTQEECDQALEEGEALLFSHTFQDLFGGQLDAPCDALLIMRVAKRDHVRGRGDLLVSGPTADLVVIELRKDVIEGHYLG